MGSGLKRVAAGSVSERYQTSFCAQFSKHLFENVKFFLDLFCEIINIQKAASKFTRYGVNLRKENVFAVSEVRRKPGNDPKNKNEERHFPQSSRKLISSKVSKVTKRSPPRLGNLISFTLYSAKSGYFEYLQWISLDGSFGKRAA